MIETKTLLSDSAYQTPSHRSWRSVMLLLLVLLAAVLLSSPGASGQSRKKREPKIIQLEEIRIEGRVQKPNAFYILNRSQLGYEVMDLRTTFVREIVRSVQGQPF